jgi:hypothetical protein
MAYSRVVKPETKLLPISGDDWLLVKRRLNHGEVSRIFIRSHDVDGHPIPIKHGLSKVAMYLLDWSLTDLAGAPLVIRGATLDDIEAALNGLEPDSVYEIHAAIIAHEEAVAAEVAVEKKTQRGATASDPTLPSPAPADGATNGSPTLIPTSTTS